jgi:hypothetical protein
MWGLREIAVQAEKDVGFRGGRFALVLGGVLVGVGILEGVLRLIGDKYERIPNADLFYFSNPRGYHDWVETREGQPLYGIRYRETPSHYRAPEEAVSAEWLAEVEESDFLAVGDSFTFGRGVRYGDTFVARLNQLLQADRSAHRIRNCGVVGADLVGVRTVYRREAARNPPRVVIYGFVLNDFGLPDVYPIVGLDLIDFNNGGYRHNPWRERSAVLNFLLSCRDRVRVHRTTLRAYRDAFDGPGADEKFRMMADFNREVTAGGARLVVILFPMLYSFGNYPLAGVHRKMGDFCNRESIPMLDLLPAFSEREAKDLWVHPMDHHPNEVAHRIAAEQIRRFLVEQKMTP